MSKWYRVGNFWIERNHYNEDNTYWFTVWYLSYPIYHSNFVTRDQFSDTFFAIRREIAYHLWDSGEHYTGKYADQFRADYRITGSWFTHFDY